MIIIIIIIIIMTSIPVFHRAFFFSQSLSRLVPVGPTDSMIHCWNFVGELGRRLNAATRDVRETAFLVQRLSAIISPRP